VGVLLSFSAVALKFVGIEIVGGCLISGCVFVALEEDGAAETDIDLFFGV